MGIDEAKAGAGKYVEGRKVQRVGKSTLAVSLPGKWVKNVKLERGDLVFFTQEEDGSLKLIPSNLAKREAEAKEFILNPDLFDEPRLLERAIVANYMVGHDLMRIVSSRRIQGEHLDEVRGIVRRLTGLNIIEESSNQIILLCSIDPAKFPIHLVIKRLYTIASTMHREAMQALADFNPTLAKEVINREDQADMMYWLIVRLLLSAQQDKSVAEKLGIENHFHIVGSRAVAVFIESIADWSENISKNVINLEKYKKEVSKHVIEKIVEISKLADTICYKATRCLYTGDIRLASSAIDSYKEIVEFEEKKVVEELCTLVSNSYVAVHLRNIAESITRIAELGAEIAQIAINRSFERPSRFCEFVEISK